MTITSADCALTPGSDETPDGPQAATVDDLADMLAAASVPLHVVAPDGTILRANRAALAMLGYEEHEYVGRNIAQLHADTEGLGDVAWRLGTGEPLHLHEAQLRHKDGTLKDVVIESSPRWRDEELVSTTCLILDVTNRRRADEAAFRLSAIVDSSDDAIVSKDLDGIVQSWNPAAERLFGYTADEIVGRSIRLIIPPGHQGEEDEVLRKVRLGEQVEHFETIRRRKNGSLVPISLTVSPVRDRRGRIIGASKIARDISEKRAAQEAIERSMVLKDQFLGLVSHELRTPISTIVGNAQLLQRRFDRLPTDARAQALTDIAHEGERLQRIIENLLVLTRVDASGELASEPVNLASFARHVVDDLRRKAHGRQISLEVEEGVPDAFAERTLLTLVLQNLIGNAEKYSPPDSPIAVILTRNGEGEPEFQVLDYGIGIEPVDVERVFDPFYRSSSGKARAPGMGLGLAVCRRILEALGGSIRAEPRPEGGTKFFFSLPAYGHGGS